MSCGLYYAVSGFKCQERELEILAHNLSNVNTVGYKDDKPSFKGVHPGITRSMTIETPDDQRRFMLNRKLNMSYPGLAQVKVDHSNGQGHVVVNCIITDDNYEEVIQEAQACFDYYSKDQKEKHKKNYNAV